MRKQDYRRIKTRQAREAAVAIGGTDRLLNQSSEAGVKGSPRPPLNNFFNRRSLELFSLRIISGVTSFELSRRALRPRSQSSQLIDSFSGMQGTFDFEFIGNFFHKRLALRQNTIFRPLCKTLDLVPVEFDFTSERSR